MRVLVMVFVLSVQRVHVNVFLVMGVQIALNGCVPLDKHGSISPLQTILHMQHSQNVPTW